MNNFWANKQCYCGKGIFKTFIGEYTNFVPYQGKMHYFKHFGISRARCNKCGEQKFDNVESMVKMNDDIKKVFPNYFES